MRGEIDEGVFDGDERELGKVGKGRQKDSQWMSHIYIRLDARAIALV